MSYKQAVLDVLQAVLCCGFYASVCFLFGMMILRLVRVFSSRSMVLSGAGCLAATFFAGQGFLGAILQAIAALGYFSARFVLTLLVVAGLSGVIYLPSMVKLIINRLCVVVKDTTNLGFFWNILVLLLMVLISIYAYLSLYPPGTDAISYYLAQAKLIAATSKIYPLPHYEAFSSLGLNAEMHAATLFLLGGDVAGEYAAKMMVWVTALVSAIMLWAISSRVGLGRRGQWMVILMLYTTTGFTLVLWDGKTDLLGAGLGLAAVYWVLQVGKSKDWQALFLAGVMVGFAMNSKLPLIVVMIPMLLSLTIWSLWTDTSQDYLRKDISEKQQKWQRLVLGLLIAGSAMILSFSALFFKNTLLFNEPLAPFYFIHPTGMSILDQTWFSPENTRWIVMTYPLALTFGQYPMQYGNITPLLLAFLPLASVFSKGLSPFRNRKLMALTLSSIAGILTWIVARPSVIAPRYILPTLLALLPLGGYIIERLWQSRKYVVLKFSVLFLSFVTVLFTIINLDEPLVVAKYYWKASPRTYAGAIWKSLNLVNQKAEQGAIIHLAMWYRLPLRADLLQCLSRKKDKLSGKKDNKITWEKLHDEGATWLVWDRLTHGKNFVEQVNSYDKPGYLSVITHPIDDRFTVYQIIPKKGAPKSNQRCIQQKDGTWQIKKQN